MSQSDWIRIKKLGFRRYVMLKGALIFGAGGGTLILFVGYLTDIDYIFSNIQIADFIIQYLIWLPATIAYGFIIALWSWISLRNKYDDEHTHQ
ncbi:MAG: hypothetical protein HRU25_02840 [Psychrobium sp.]|nr:hypothetical protein [Psychrobium sp.]